LSNRPEETKKHQKFTKKSKVDLLLKMLKKKRKRKKSSTKRLQLESWEVVQAKLEDLVCLNERK